MTRAAVLALLTSALLMSHQGAHADTTGIGGRGAVELHGSTEQAGATDYDPVPPGVSKEAPQTQPAGLSDIPYTSPTAGCIFFPYNPSDAVDPQARPESTVDPACFDTDPADPAAPDAPARPQVTQAMVQRAFERVPVPAFASQTQPVGKTLVNFDTIFYVEAEPMTEQVTLLGQQVTLYITPSTYTWDHGDGTTETTTTPGAAYPSKEVVHRYADARTTVQHHVSIEWTATYSVDGGPAQPVDGTVVTTGPTTDLRISEAAPALSGDR